MIRRKRSEADFAEEIKAHLELEAEELRQEGLSEAEARRRARSGFGSVRVAQERFHMRGRVAWLDKLGRDVRFGLRALWHSPGFAVTAIVTLALGMGANTAVFSVMNAVLLRNLLVEDPERLVYLQTSNSPRNTGTIDSHGTFSYPVYDALRRQTGALKDVVAVGLLSSDKVNVRIGAQPEQALADMVSGNFFSGLGVKLALGRGFLANEEKDHAQVVVISYAYWTRRFSRDPGVIGSTVFVKGVPFTVVGVTAEGFEGTESGQSLDFWIPLQDRIEFNVLGNPPERGQLYQHDPTWWCLRLLGRLAPGVSRERALGELQNVFRAAATIGPGAPKAGEQPPVLSFMDAKNFPGYDEQYGKPLRMLMAMVGLVLLIAVTNVVMLLMARNASRQREFSLRMALGAGRGELLLQLLTESLLLVTAGGVLAWGFAELATRTLARWALIDASLAPDRTVLLFSLAVLMGIGLLFGLAPLRVAMAGGVGLALKTSAATSNADAGKMRVGRAIVTLQMAMCVVLLVGGGLLVRTLRNLRTIPLGMRTEGLVVFGLNPQSLHDEPAVVRFYEEVQRRLRLLPGVESVAVSQERLGSGWSNNANVMVDGKDPDASRGGQTIVRSNDVGPGFFRTLGVPVVMGREFNDADVATSRKAAVVSELFVKTFFPDGNPIGHEVNGLTIVGVVKNHKYRGMNEDPIPMAWWNYGGAPEEGEMQVEMRVRGDAMAILPEVQKVVAGLDPNLPLIEPMLQQEQFEKTISQELMFARLGEFFGLLAVVLVGTGLYGTLAYRVNMRTAEIGVRMAVGARREQVVWMVLRDSLWLTVAGIAAGVPLAMLVGRALSANLYGVKAWDVSTYLLAVLGVVAIALAASAVPAGRAASIAPSSALRLE